MDVNKSSSQLWLFGIVMVCLIAGDLNPFRKPNDLLAVHTSTCGNNQFSNRNIVTTESVGELKSPKIEIKLTLFAIN